MTVKLMHVALNHKEGDGPLVSSNLVLHFARGPALLTILATPSFGGYRGSAFLIEAALFEFP